MKEQTKGITLIALVVTIIVLLILAGVAISLSLGNNGIFNRAQKAKDVYAMADLKEEVSMLVGSRDIDGELGTKIGLKEDLEQGIKGNKIIEEANGLTDVYYVTRDNQSITVYENGDIVEGKISIWDGSSKSKPEVDEERNWHIYTTEELKYFADFVNGNLTEEEKAGLTIEETTIVYLEKDLDLGARQEEGTLTNGSKWTPIGKGTQFIGTFEGNNHFIKGEYIDQTENFAGFFGQANIIKNLTIKDSYILGGSCAGGIVGLGKTIENCHNINTTVISRGYTNGGIAGQVNKSITNCSNTGTIIDNGASSSGNSQVGGIAGNITSSVTASNCKNSGAVTGQGNRVGGIVGNANTSSKISNSSNIGTVTGKESYVGGIAGYSNGTVNNCNNAGVITGEGDRVGGIAGNASASATITECSNSGTVTGKGSGVGGIVGALFGNIEKCYNVGEIKQTAVTEGLGGICGQIGANCTANIKKCYNKGKIIAEEECIGVGGIVGWISKTETSGEISNNYNIGQIVINGEKVTKIGGVIGRIETDTFTRANNYYVEGTFKTEDNTEGESKTAEEMKKQEFVDLLNTGLEENVWEINSNRNDGYPIIIANP